MKQTNLAALRVAALIAMAAIGCSSCAEQKQVIDAPVVSQLQSGTSSNDVLAMLGRPTFVHTYSDGARSLGYVRRCAKDASTEPCKSASGDSPWQICEINFNRTDRYSGLACSWSAHP
jgi:hypothetical protein